jgi:stage V sporulation protein B
MACMAVIGGSYGAGAFSFLLLLRRLRRDLPPPGALPPVARTALPLGLNDWLRAGLGAVEQFLIPWGLERTGSRHAALAAYGTISGMVFPLLWFPAEIIFSLCELLVSELARLLAKKEHRRLRRLVRKSLGLTALYALGVSAALYLGGGLLGRALFQSEEAGRLLRIFAPMVLFLYPDAVVDGLQKGLGQQLHLVRYNSFTNVIDVLGLWLLLPRFGLAGYVFTYCLSHLVNLFLSLRRLLLVTEDPALCEAP